MRHSPHQTVLADFIIQADFMFHIISTTVLGAFWCLIQFLLIAASDGQYQPSPTDLFAVTEHHTSITGLLVGQFRTTGKFMQSIAWGILRSIANGTANSSAGNSGRFDVNTMISPFILFKVLLLGFTAINIIGYALAILPFNFLQALLRAKIKQSVGIPGTYPRLTQESLLMTTTDDTPIDGGMFFNTLPFLIISVFIFYGASNPYVPWLGTAIFSSITLLVWGFWQTINAYKGVLERRERRRWHFLKLSGIALIVIWGINLNLWVGNIIGLFFNFIALCVTFGEPQASTRREVLRGRDLQSADMVHMVMQEAVKSEGKRGIFFGGTKTPESFATKHFMVVGGTGSGKTLTLNMMMQSILPYITPSSNKRALLFDSKQELLPLLDGMNLKVPVIPMHPFDERGYAWDISADITEPSHAIAMADILVPPTKGDNNTFFRDAVSVLMSEVITYFIRHAQSWTLRDVLLAMESQERIVSIISSDPVTRKSLSVLGEDKTAANIRATLRAKLNRYEVIAASWHHAKKSISLRQWVNTESILVLGHDFTSESSLRAVNQILFTRAAQLLNNKPESNSPSSFLIFDELPIAGKLDQLEKLCTFGRSKGVSVTMAFQDIGQLWEIYGRDIADAMLNQCNSRAYLRLSGEKTAEWASKNIGSQEIRETRESVSRSESEGKISRSTSTSINDRSNQVVMPGELTGLPETTPRNGLRGIYDLSSLLFWHTMSWEEIEAHLPRKNSSTPGHIRRPESTQFLEPWDDSDLQRLGLVGLLDSKPSSPPPVELSSLFSGITDIEDELWDSDDLDFSPPPTPLPPKPRSEPETRPRPTAPSYEAPTTPTAGKSPQLKRRQAKPPQAPIENNSNPPLKRRRSSTPLPPPEQPPKLKRRKGNRP